MRKAVALLLAGGLLAIAALAGTGGIVTGADDNRAISRPTAGRFNDTFASQTQSSELDLLKPATKMRRGVFTTDSGTTLEVFEGERSRLFDGGGPVATTVRRCVSAVSAGFNAMACSPVPLFADSDVLFVESWSGGPVTSDRSDYMLAGIASPRVARIEAVTSDDAVVAGRLSKDRAFVVELPDEDVRGGVMLTTLNVHGDDGLLRSIDLAR
jgi:hypothetical protein